MLRGFENGLKLPNVEAKRYLNGEQYLAMQGSDNGGGFLGSPANFRGGGLSEEPA